MCSPLTLKLHLLVSPAVGRPLYTYILSYLILTLQFFCKNYSINLQSLQYSRSFLYSNVSSLFIKTIPVLSVHLIISSFTGIKFYYFIINTCSFSFISEINLLNLSDDFHFPATTIVLLLLFYISFRIVSYLFLSKNDNINVYFLLLIGDAE